MSDAEHLIENAIMALERYPYEEAERYFMEAPINIMMSKDSGCPLNAVWEMAIFCDTTLRQDWKEKWEKEAERWIPVTERLPEALVKVLILTQRAIGKSRVMAGQYSRLTELWYIGEYSTQAKVTHWMPLPEEPKEEKMPKEYIDREYYCNNICRCPKTECDKTKCPIWTAPAADVAPVVHGTIIETIKDGKFNRVFSCCGKDYTTLTMWMTPKHCPNCGAKMDGGKK